MTFFKNSVVQSSIDKWGNQQKTTKQKNRDFMILELKGTKNLRY